MPEGLTLEEIIFVNDGSTDSTKFQISNFKLKIEKKTKVKLITYKQNMGKGHAIRKGMLASKSDYTLFFDADMSTPLSELKRFIPGMQKGLDVVIGTRKNGHSTVVVHRHYIVNPLQMFYPIIPNDS
jgi:dolichyl-phosphate beta-glucosyltransferase